MITTNLRIPGWEIQTIEERDYSDSTSIDGWHWSYTNKFYVKIYNTDNLKYIDYEFNSVEDAKFYLQLIFPSYFSGSVEWELEKMEE